MKRRLRLELGPANHLKREAAEREAWITTGDDPCFELGRSKDFPLAPGHYQIVFHLAHGLDLLRNPCFYLKTGADYSELDKSHPRIFARVNGVCTCYLKIGKPLNGLRFDPCETAGVRFALASIDVIGMEPHAWFTRLASDLAGDSAGGTQASTATRWLRLARFAREADMPAFFEQLELAAANEKTPDGLYRAWLKKYQFFGDKQRQAVLAGVAVLKHRPTFSFVMPVYNPPREVLERAIASVEAQLYPDWELCIADDASTRPWVRETLDAATRRNAKIKVVYRETNGHISAASNTALEIASGDWIALIDHDDEIPPDALYVMAEYINAYPNAHLLYSDEDKIDLSGKRFDPYFKPDWNEHLFFSYNMISHFGVYKTQVVRKIGGFRLGFEGAQDYDLALRTIEQSAAGQIVHVPHILYHWRVILGSAAAGPDEKNYALDAAMRALNEYFVRKGYRGKVDEHPHPALRGCSHPFFEIPDPAPRVSIIIPTRNRADLLKICVSSILAKTGYKSFEIVVVDNGSTEKDALKYMSELSKAGRIRLLHFDGPFNFAAINNFAVNQCHGELVCFLNNDTQVFDGDWLGEMVSHAARPDIGAVGARLFYPDMSLQHAGVYLGLTGSAAHGFLGLPQNNLGYMSRAVLTQEVSAVTAACMLVSRKAFWRAGGFDERAFPVAYNDIDFCLRLRELGYRNIYAPQARLIHAESQTRGLEDTPEKKARFDREFSALRQRWGHFIAADPAYNPNLTIEKVDFSLSSPPRLLPIRGVSGAIHQAPLRDAAPADHPLRFEYDLHGGDLPAPFRDLPREVRDAASAHNSDSFGLTEVTIDGWRTQAPRAEIIASDLVRVCGWAYAGAGAQLVHAFARLRINEHTQFLPLTREPRPDNVTKLQESAAHDCGFDIRIDRPAGAGAHGLIDIIHIYENRVVEFSGILAVRFDDSLRGGATSFARRSRLSRWLDKIRGRLPG